MRVTGFGAALALIGSLGCAATAAAQNGFVLVRLASGFSPPFDINDGNTAVGFWNGSSGSRAYIWTQATGAQPLITDLTIINRFPFYTGVQRNLAINDQNVVTGQGDDNGARRAATYSTAGGLTILGGETGRGINASGVVVGTYRSNAMIPFVWRPGTGLEFPFPLTHSGGTTGADISDAGVIVGTCAAGSPCVGQNTAYTWTSAGGVVNLPRLSTEPTASYDGLAINSQGHVAGRYQGTASGAFFWSPATGTIDLAAPSGFIYLMDINDAGDIVATIGNTPYLRRNGTWIDLNAFLPPGGGFRLHTVRAINNNGWIVGEGSTSVTTNLQFGYVLVPASVVSLSGTVTIGSGAGAAPLVNSPIALTGSISASTTTDAQGRYTFPNVPVGGPYTITPGAAAFVFSPASRTLTNVAADTAGLDFVAAPLTRTISGQVRDRNDTGVPGIPMQLTGGSTATTTTDADGYYSFTVPDGLNYTITPSRTGFVFTPPAQSFTNVRENRVASFFVASPGVFTRYFAEGATGSFFDTTIALLNATGAVANVTVRFQRSDGQIISIQRTLAGLERATIDPETLPGLEGASFSTVIESTQPLIADRTMRWDQSRYGSHAETSIAAPLTRWYLAEGATTGGFNVYYLIQNATSQAAQIEIRYLLRAPAAPVVKTYTVGANTRRTIYVNGEGSGLEEADVSAVVTSTNGVPVIVERAMYLDSNGQLFGAGHDSAAIPEPSLSWLFAEGATGPFFNMYLLVANPNDQVLEVSARYLLPNGDVIAKSYTVAANSRFTISVNSEDPQLAATPVSTTLTSANNVAFLAERSMWWPAIPLVAQWQEGHNSVGAVRTGEKWGLADGELGGASGLQTYVLIANTSAFGGEARVTLFFEDGGSVDKTVPLPPRSRTNVGISAEFPAAAGRRFATLVESLGATPAQIVVERAMYTSPGGVTWAAGTNALATSLP